MNRLDMAIELIKEARDEMERYLQYQKEYSEAIEKGIYDDIRSVEAKYRPTPSKALVNANLKTARRILAQEYFK